MAAAACGAVTAAGASPLDISYEEIPLEKIKAEDTLILSDSPEYARNYGILAEGTVLKGKGRIYYYHVKRSKSSVRSGGNRAAATCLRERRFLSEK